MSITKNMESHYSPRYSSSLLDPFLPRIQLVWEYALPCLGPHTAHRNMQDPILPCIQLFRDLPCLGTCTARTIELNGGTSHSHATCTDHVKFDELFESHEKSNGWGLLIWVKKTKEPGKQQQIQCHKFPQQQSRNLIRVPLDHYFKVVLMSWALNSDHLCKISLVTLVYVILNR